MTRRNGIPREKRNYPTFKVQQINHEKRMKKTRASEPGFLTGDVSRNMKEDDVRCIITPPSSNPLSTDRKVTHGDGIHNNRRLTPKKRGRKSGVLSSRRLKAETSKLRTMLQPAQERKLFRLIKLNKQRMDANKKTGLSRRQYRNIMKQVNASRIQVMTIAGVKFNSNAAKFFTDTVAGMKKQVTQYANNNGCGVAYSGKNRIMYLKEGYTPELEQAILDKFGYGLPFKIMADELA